MMIVNEPKYNKKIKELNPSLSIRKNRKLKGIILGGYAGKVDILRSSLYFHGTQAAVVPAEYTSRVPMR